MYNFQSAYIAGCRSALLLMWIVTAIAPALPKLNPYIVVSKNNEDRASKRNNRAFSVRISHDCCIAFNPPSY